MVEFEGIIDGEYAKLRTEGADRCQVYANLIAIKRHAGLDNYEKPLYVDVKEWIRMIAEDFELHDYGYDVIPVGKVVDVIESFPVSRQASLFRFFYLKCGDIERGILKKHLQVARYRKYKEDGRWLSALLVRVGTDWRALLCCLLAVVVAIMIIMLPSPLGCMEIFNVSLQAYSPSGLLNYLSNALAVLAGIDTPAPSISPVNFTGVAVFGFCKLTLFGLIINFIYQKLIEYIETLSNE